MRMDSTLDTQGERTVVSFDAQSLRLDSAQDAEVICKEIAGKQVEVLILQGNTFNIEAAERIGLELAHQPTLREAHFKDLFTSRGREVVPDAMRHLLRGIVSSGAQLELLDLSDNAIGPIGAPSVIEFLESPAAERLKRLYLNNCGLGPEGSTSIAATISSLRYLEEFICGRNRLENKGAGNMSRALSELACLKKLTLNQNGIFVEGITSLVDALSANIETLTELDLSDNTIKKEGALVLAKVISKAKNLKVVRLDDAILKNDGFEIICHAFAKSPSLSTLKLASFEGNELRGNKIVDVIIATFGSCTDFTLDLLENEFKPDQLARLETLGDRFSILLDDIDEDDESEDDDDDESHDSNSEDTEEGEIRDGSDEHENDGSDDSDGYVEIGDITSEIREVSQDFIDAFQDRPFSESNVYPVLMQLLSTGARNKGNGQGGYQVVQILCEELGLIKCEDTRRKKPLSRDAVIYLAKHLKELPADFRNFFEVVVKNNDELSCGKLLFDKLDI